MKFNTVKKLMLTLPVLAGILFSSFKNIKSNAEANKDLSGNVSISGAFALYPLAVKWGDEFKKLHPNVKFDIQGGGAGKGITDVLSGTVTLGMVSRDINDEETKKGAIAYAVAKDAVVPTVNAANPYLSIIQKKGITKQQLIDIWVTGKIKTWGDLLGNGAKEKILVYTRSDAAGAAETWAKYLGKKQEDLLGVGVFGDPGLVDAVTQNKLSIGFNNVSFVYDNKTKKPNNGIRPFPIDLDGNGQLTANENVYASTDVINDAIIKGVYPSPPARNLLFVSKGNVTDATTAAFLKWILTDGQKFVAESGYVKLSDDLLQKELKKLK